MKCSHCLEVEENEIGELIALCELKGRFMNATLGECFGNCESEDGEYIPTDEEILDAFAKDG